MKKIILLPGEELELVIDLYSSRQRFVLTARPDGVRVWSTGGDILIEPIMANVVKVKTNETQP